MTDSIGGVSQTNDPKLVHHSPRKPISPLSQRKLNLPEALKGRTDLPGILKRRDYWFCLLLASCGEPGLAALHRLFDTIDRDFDAWERASEARWVEELGLQPDQAELLATQLGNPAARVAALREAEKLDKLSIQLISKSDPRYPHPYRTGMKGPPLLWVMGDLLPDDLWTLAILGTASCTTYGVKQAKVFARQCANHGITIVNGGEKGIDTAASKAALDAGGRTIIALGAGVLAHGRGLDGFYKEIAESGQGAVLSSVPSLTVPSSLNQVVGDYLVTGLALATLIAEAGPGSGALVAARIADEEFGRPIFAIPGPIDSIKSKGPLRLIKEGQAQAATDPSEFINDLSQAIMALRIRLVSHGPVESDAYRLFQALTPLPDRLTSNILNQLTNPTSPEELAQRIGMDSRPLLARIFQLRCQGVLTQSHGRYQLAEALSRSTDRTRELWPAVYRDGFQS